jgi:hypothetical protein
MFWRTSLRKLLPKDLRRGFDSLVLLAGWLLWKERNDRTFNRVASTLTQLVAAIHQEATLWVVAGYKHLGALDARRH